MSRSIVPLQGKAVVDPTSPGFLISVISASPETRIQGHPDPSSGGQVLDKMSDTNERVISFEFEDNDRAQRTLKLEVDNFDLNYFDHPAWVKGNLVRFIFGYPGRIQGPFTFLIDNMRGFQKLSISCIEQAALANEMKTKIFKNMSRTEVVQLMVAQNLFPGVTNVDIEATALADEKSRDWQQARQTDYQFVQKLAEDPGFEVFVEDDTLHFHPRRLSKSPAKKYEWYYGTGDFLEFNIEEYRTQDRAAEATVAGRDPLTRENFAPKGSNTATKRDTLGKESTLVIGRNRTTGNLAGKRILTTPERDKATAKNQADAAFRVGEMGEVKASMTIVGDPLVRAKQIIEVVGISQALSGNFYISKNVHKIDSSGYKSALSVIKNALEVLPTTTPPVLDQGKAKDNKQGVPADRRQVIVRDPIVGNLYQTKR